VIIQGIPDAASDTREHWHKWTPEEVEVTGVLEWDGNVTWEVKADGGPRWLSGTSYSVKVAIGMVINGSNLSVQV